MCDTTRGMELSNRRGSSRSRSRRTQFSHVHSASGRRRRRRSPAKTSRRTHDESPFAAEQGTLATPTWSRCVASESLSLARLPEDFAQRMVQHCTPSAVTSPKQGSRNETTRISRYPPSCPSIAHHPSRCGLPQYMRCISVTICAKFPGARTCLERRPVRARLRNRPVGYVTGPMQGVR